MHKKYSFALKTALLIAIFLGSFLFFYSNANAVIYFCSAGWSPSATNPSVCEQTGTLASYSCPSGGVYSGNAWCDTSTSHSPSVSYSCPSGGALLGTNTCTATTAYPATQSGWSCSIGTFSWSYVGCMTAAVKSQLPGYANLNSVAYNDCVMNYGGNGNGNTACNTQICGLNSTCAAKFNYTCPTGILVNATALSTAAGSDSQVLCYSTPNPTYICPSGGTLTFDPSIATYICATTSTYLATPAYACNPGETYLNSLCITPSGYSAIPIYSCPNGGTLNGTVCTLAATATLQCNPGDTFIAANNTCQPNTLYEAPTCPAGSTLIGSNCQPNTLYITPRQNYACIDKDGNGAIDPFTDATKLTCRPDLLTQAALRFDCVDADGQGAVDQKTDATNRTCRPDLLTNLGQKEWYCPVVAGDPVGAAQFSASPATIQAGWKAWEGGTGWYLLNGVSKLSTIIQASNLTGPACQFTPITVDALYNFSTYDCPATLAATVTYSCASGTLTGANWDQCTRPGGTTPASPSYSCPNGGNLQSIGGAWYCTTSNLNGTMCRPFIQKLGATGTTDLTCGSVNDVKSGATCTPPIIIKPAIPVITYTCNPLDPNAPPGTPPDALSGVSHLCYPAQQTATPTATQGYLCGNNAKLNTTTKQCEYISMPAISVGGQLECAAGYILSGSWCVPQAAWAYPAAWELNHYSCPQGGTLGMQNGVPNGLCYQ